MTDKTVTPAIEREIYLLFASHWFCGNEPCAGNHLIMERNNSQYALYAHLKPNSITTFKWGTWSRNRQWRTFH